MVKNDKILRALLLFFVLVTLFFLFKGCVFELYTKKERFQTFEQKQNPFTEYEKMISYYSKNKIDPTLYYRCNLKSNPIVLQSFDQMGKVITFNSWNTLSAELSDLKFLFPIIWIPPVAKSTGKPGYIPLSYTNLNSYWGTESDLARLAANARNQNVELMADMVFHHSENPYFDVYDDKTNTKADLKDKKWFETEVVSGNRKDIDYIPLWMSTNFKKDQPLAQNGFVNYSESFDGQQSCLTKNSDGMYTINSNCVPVDGAKVDCTKVLPMYTFNKDVMDGGGLQALNLCNLEIIENQIKFLNKLYQMGITSFRYDQINGIDPYHMRLYNNSNINKTSLFLAQIIDHCKKSRLYPQCDQVYVNQIEDKAQKLLDNVNALQLQRFTTLGHNYAVGEVFTPGIDKYNLEKEDKPWYSLVGELEAMNEGLDPKDQIGVFDFGLRSVVKSVFESKDESLLIDNTKWKDLMNLSVIGYQNQKYTKKYPCLAYTFADNHDTDYMLAFYGSTYEDRGAPSGLAYNRLILGYFIILLMPGYPVVYKFHYSWFKPITAFIMLRQILGIRYDSKLEIPKINGQNYILWKITNSSGKIITFAIVDNKKIGNDFSSNVNDNNLIYKYPLPRTENIEMRIYSDSSFKPSIVNPEQPGQPTVVNPEQPEQPDQPIIYTNAPPGLTPPAFPAYPSLRPFPVQSCGNTQICKEKPVLTCNQPSPQSCSKNVCLTYGDCGSVCNSSTDVYSLNTNIKYT